jgi:hypothetical protein
MTMYVYPSYCYTHTGTKFLSLPLVTLSFVKKCMTKRSTFILSTPGICENFSIDKTLSWVLASMRPRSTLLCKEVHLR